jgi:2-polyprenyl-3-methyl-5-hydroxy-6-metoxy-1,4-benzoquinol methylase
MELIPDRARNVLEVGTAEGRMGKFIKENKPGLIVDGVEINEFLANQAKPFYHSFYHTSFENFTPETTYDSIICGDVIEHMENPWQQIGRMFQMLNPGGCLIASLPNAGHWTLVKDLLFGKFQYLPVGITCITHLRWFTEETIKTALSEAGFVIELLQRQQQVPSPDGKNFIRKMVETGYGNEQSLLTSEFILKATKQ